MGGWMGLADFACALPRFGEPPRVPHRQEANGGWIWGGHQLRGRGKITVTFLLVSSHGTELNIDRKVLVSFDAFDLRWG